MKITDFERFLRLKFKNENIRLRKCFPYHLVERSISSIKDSEFSIKIWGFGKVYCHARGSIFILDPLDNKWKYSGVSIINCHKFMTKKKIYIKYGQ